MIGLVVTMRPAGPFVVLDARSLGCPSFLTYEIFVRRSGSVYDVYGRIHSRVNSPTTRAWFSYSYNFIPSPSESVEARRGWLWLKIQPAVFRGSEDFLSKDVRAFAKTVCTEAILVDSFFRLR